MCGHLGFSELVFVSAKIWISQFKQAFISVLLSGAFLLAWGSHSHAAEVFATYAGTTGGGCHRPAVFANSATELGILASATNNSITTMTCGAKCRNPTTFVSADTANRTYTVVSNCTGTQYTHPYRIIDNPKESDECPAPSVGNPINPITGNKYQFEEDYESADGFLFFQRYYKTRVGLFETFEHGSWTHNYANKIVYIDAKNVLPAHVSLAYVARYTGQVITFKDIASDGNWVSDPDITQSLVQVSSNGVTTGWRYTLSDDQVEEYDDKGRMIALIKRDGRKQTLVYDDAANTVTITDQYSNKQLILQKNSSDQVIKMIDPAGHEYNYTYLSSGLYQSVIYPDSTPEDLGDNPSRLYHYEDTNFPTALTGITDEAGKRYITWAYDGSGRAILSELANGTGRVSIDYTEIDNSVDPRVTVTNEFGKNTTYHFTTIQGVRKIKSIEGHASTNCDAANQHYTYDENGFRDEIIDWEGHITDYDYDARGLEIKRVEAKGTDEQRTITTQWHTDYRLPIKITEPDRVINFTYSADGKLLERKEAAMQIN